MKYLITLFLSLFLYISLYSQSSLSLQAHYGTFLPGITGMNTDQVRISNPPGLIAGVGLSYRSSTYWSASITSEYMDRSYSIHVNDCDCVTEFHNDKNIGIIIQTSYGLLRHPEKSQIFVGLGVSFLTNTGTYTNVIITSSPAKPYYLQQSISQKLLSTYATDILSARYEYSIIPGIDVFVSSRVGNLLFNSRTQRKINIIYNNPSSGVAFDQTFHFNNVVYYYFDIGLRFHLWDRN